MAPIEEPAATRFFIGRALDGVPVGDLLEVRVPQWRLLFGHDDLR